ncbi:MAG: MOSC domain-containing protein [Candidatus Methylomirabilia bacterium]
MTAYLDVHVRDIFPVGTALFEVTQPRGPCHKPASQTGVEGSCGRILESGRLRSEFRVLQEADLTAGGILESGATKVIRRPLSP